MCDGSCNFIYKCKLNCCKLKSNFISRDEVVSADSKRIFDCVVPNWATCVNCNSLNVIYIITGNRCSLQFIGRTFQKLNNKFNWYRTGFNQRNVDSVTFYQIISTKAFVEVLHIQSKY